MLGETMNAAQAVKSGFANAILPALQNEPDWFDIAKVPAVRKLSETDYRTLINCKSLMNAARDNDKINKALEEEAVALVDTWCHPEFAPKFKAYLAKALKK